MALHIVRNDITRMHTDAIVNTANPYPVVGPGCDTAIYNAAGYDELLSYRREHIGHIPEGGAFVTPAFNLPFKCIIHAVSPLFINGESGEEEKLRDCYRNSLKLADEQGLESIAFPLISTGSFGYPKEEGLRIAADEINAFLLEHEMEIYIVVFGQASTNLGNKLFARVPEHIDSEYVTTKFAEEYSEGYIEDVDEDFAEAYRAEVTFDSYVTQDIDSTDTEACVKHNVAPKFSIMKEARRFSREIEGDAIQPTTASLEDEACAMLPPIEALEDKVGSQIPSPDDEDAYFEYVDQTVAARLAQAHEDTFTERLMNLIEAKGLTTVEVYTRGVVKKRLFSQIKNNPNAHPKKITVLCLCVGAQLTLEETEDLLARAGYALSPCDTTDIIFKFFIENGLYNIFDISIQLEEYGIPCIIE